MNFLKAKGSLAPGQRDIQINGGTLGIPVTREALDVPEAILGARPEHISLCDQGHLRGKVFAIEYMGARQLITVDTDAGRLKVRMPNSTRVIHGQSVGLEFDAEKLIVFNPQTDLALNSALFDGGAS